MQTDAPEKLKTSDLIHMLKDFLFNSATLSFTLPNFFKDDMRFWEKGYY